MITKNCKVPKKRGGTALMGPMCAPIHIILYPSAHLETVEHFLDTNDDQECIVRRSLNSNRRMS